MGNNLTPKELRTVDYYNKSTSKWSNSNNTYKFWGSMNDFYKLLPTGKVIEIGCGAGRDAQDYLIGKYDYIGTDISDGLLKVARNNNPTAVFLKQSLYNLDFAENLFDGFWASAVLLHVPKNKINKALSQILRVVKNNGIGFITLKEGNGEKVTEDGRFFNYYTNEEFTKVLNINDFEVLRFHSFPNTETKTTWLTYLVKVKK